MISFQNKSIKFNLKGKSKLREWLETVAQKEKYRIKNLHYIFCNDEELLEINSVHLNHYTFTDIITFDYTEEKKVMSDIFISIERVTENAKKYGVTFEEELHRVMIHGVLHLCGYKDKTKAEIEQMRKKENSALKLLQSP